MSVKEEEEEKEGSSKKLLSEEDTRSLLIYVEELRKENSQKTEEIKILKRNKDILLEKENKFCKYSIEIQEKFLKTLKKLKIENDKLNLKLKNKQNVQLDSNISLKHENHQIKQAIEKYDKSLKLQSKAINLLQVQKNNLHQKLRCKDKESTKSNHSMREEIKQLRFENDRKQQALERKIHRSESSSKLKQKIRELEKKLYLTETQCTDFDRKIQVLKRCNDKLRNSSYKQKSESKISSSARPTISETKKGTPTVQPQQKGRKKRSSSLVRFKDLPLQTEQQVRFEHVKSRFRNQFKALKAQLDLLRKERDLEKDLFQTVDLELQEVKEENLVLKEKLKKAFTLINTKLRLYLTNFIQKLKLNTT